MNVAQRGNGTGGIDRVQSLSMTVLALCPALRASSNIITNGMHPGKVEVPNGMSIHTHCVDITTFANGPHKCGLLLLIVMNRLLRNMASIITRLGHCTISVCTVYTVCTWRKVLVVESARA